MIKESFVTELAASVPARSVKSTSRVLVATFVGTAIEWYDFFIYGTAAALVFNRLFFPTVDPLVGTLSAFGTFAIGFVARPVGGIIFGHYGDRLGRKSMLVYSLLIMGAATFATGLLPSYDAVGIWAPIFLIVLRMAQGIGLGGEWGGAVLMAVEHSPHDQRGFWGSWPQMGAFAGLLLSTFVFSVVTFATTSEQFLSWGWRVPFLLSVFLIGLGMFIRSNIPETPAFSTVKHHHAEQERPVMSVLRDYRKNTALAILMRFGENTLFYIYTVFVLTYAQSRLGIPRQSVLAAITCAAAIGCLSVLSFGALSDRVGRRPVYLFGALFSLAFAFPFFWLINTRSTIVIAAAIVVGLNIGHNAMYGPQAAYFSELFGANVRYSGASLAVQLSAAFAGGLAPLIATALMVSGGSLAVSAYMVVMCAITATATYFAPETYRSDLA